MRRKRLRHPGQTVSLDPQLFIIDRRSGLLLHISSLLARVSSVYCTTQRAGLLVKYLQIWLRYCRKARQETPQVVSDLAAESCTMEEAAIDGEEKISFYKKLSALDEPYKTVVFLRLASDLTFQEIGQILDKNGTWARVIYYRAKERLKKLYEKE